MKLIIGWDETNALYCYWRQEGVGHPVYLGVARPNPDTNDMWATSVLRFLGGRACQLTDDIGARLIKHLFSHHGGSA